MRQNDVPEVGKGQIDVPVGVDTTEELRAEVHVVEVAVKEEGPSERVSTGRKREENRTYSTTWSQLRSHNNNTDERTTGRPRQ
jgi:hypothetical protein